MFSVGSWWGLGWSGGYGVVESEGASVVGGQCPASRVDGCGWDEPGVSVGAHDDVPAVVVDRGVARPAEQAAVVDGGGSAVGVVGDVVDVASGGGCPACDAATITQDHDFPGGSGEQAWSGGGDRDRCAVEVESDAGQPCVTREEFRGQVADRAHPCQ